MNRVLVAVPAVLALAAAGMPDAPGRSAEPALCERMTPARMLENPDLASAYAQALRSGEAEVARVRSLFEQIRTAHGCAGAVSLPSAPRVAPRLPPGHPPVLGRERAPRLPAPDAPATFTI
jgi:hypothetical protein